MSPRPLSVRIFGWLMLAATLVSLGLLAFNYRALHEEAVRTGQSPLGTLFAMMLVSGYNLCFWVAIARRASNTARWLFLTVTALELVNMALGWAAYRSLGSIPSLVAVAFQAAAALVLLRQDSAEWLAARGRLPGPEEIFR